MAPNVPERPERSPDQVAIDLAVRLGFLGLFAYFSLTLVRPFMPVLLWSVVLAVAFHPAYEWLRARLGRSWLASGCLTLFGLLIVVGPATVLIASLIHSLEHLGHQLGAGQLDLPPPPQALDDIPVVGDDLNDAWNLASIQPRGLHRAATARRCSVPASGCCTRWRGSPAASW